MELVSPYISYSEGISSHLPRQKIKDQLSSFYKRIYNKAKTAAIRLTPCLSLPRVKIASGRW
jgi:hypothetical protein